MGVFTITSGAYANKKPTEIGSNSKSIAHGSTYVFTKDSIKSETVPPYSDPEGDEIDKLKILTMTGVGTLALNGTPVVVNQEIDLADIEAGLLIYTPPVATTTTHTWNLTFDISDSGSNQFSLLTTGLFKIVVDALTNLAPSSVGDRTESIQYGETLIITAAMLTTGTTPPYADPEGDAASMLKITSLPTTGTLKLDGVDVVLNQEITFTDINANKLTFSNNLKTIAATSAVFNFEIADSGSNQYTA